jgi:hypothetical protein
MAVAPANTAASRGPDILVRTGPALSATTDAPLADVPKPPVSASNNPADQASGIRAEMTVEEKAAAARARTAASGEDPASAADPAVDPGADPAAKTDDDGKKVTPPYVQREITKARNRQREAQAAAEEAKAAAKAATDALTAAQAELAELKAKADQPKVEQPAPDPKPARDQFDDPDAYDTALTEWATREGERKVVEKAAAERAEAEKKAEEAKAEEARKAQEAEAAKLQADWSTKREAAIEKYADYVEVAEGDHPVSVPMAHAIMLAENGTDVAYHLGQNPEEAARIAALPNVGMQLFEMGRLSARLATPVTRAPRPAPIEPIDTNNAPADTSEREPSMDEYGHKRLAQLRSARTPFFQRSNARH